MQSSVDVIARSGYFIVRICEDGKHSDTPFKILDFAQSYACGQRIRLNAMDAIRGRVYDREVRATKAEVEGDRS